MQKIHRTQPLIHHSHIICDHINAKKGILRTSVFVVTAHFVSAKDNVEMYK